MTAWQHKVPRHATPRRFPAVVLRMAGIVCLALTGLALAPGAAQARNLSFGSYGDSYGILTGSQSGGQAGTFTFTGSSGTNTTVTGDVGVGNNEALTGSHSGSITGSLYQGSAVTGSLGASVGGSTVTSTNPATGIASAQTFSTQAAALAPTLSVSGNAINLSATSGSKSQTITLSAGQNVLNVTSLSLSTSSSHTSTLTISGTANERLIINDSGAFNIAGRSSIVLTGGITAADIIFNVTGTSGVSISGATSSHAQTIAGTILAPTNSITLSGYTTLTGSVIGAFGTQSTAYNFSDGPNFKISYVAYAPEPSSLAIIGVALGALCFIRRRKPGDSGAAPAPG